MGKWSQGWSAPHHPGTAGEWDINICAKSAGSSQAAVAPGSFAVASDVLNGHLRWGENPCNDFLSGKEDCSAGRHTIRLETWKVWLEVEKTVDWLSYVINVLFLWFVWSKHWREILKGAGESFKSGLLTQNLYLPSVILPNHKSLYYIMLVYHLIHQNSCSLHYNVWTNVHVET